MTDQLRTLGQKFDFLLSLSPTEPGSANVSVGEISSSSWRFDFSFGFLINREVLLGESSCRDFPSPQQMLDPVPGSAVNQPRQASFVEFELGLFVSPKLESLMSRI